MAYILIMPRQGNTVESCIITDWKVKEGDTVAPETTACDVETDKAAFEIPAGAAGTVLKLLCACGDDVPVLRPIAVIGAPGEDWQAALGEGSEKGGKEASKNAPSSPKPEAQSIPSPQNAPSMRGHGAAAGVSPRARNLAAQEALPLPTSGTGPGGRIIERDVAAALENRPPLTVAAKVFGPQVVPVAGTGIGGRVTTADLTAGPGVAPVSPAPGPRPPASPGEGAVTETPVKGIRKIISDRMLHSLSESAQFTLNASASAVKIQEIRGGIKTLGALAEGHGISKITINDLVLFAVSRTLPRFPYMNAHKTGDTVKTFEQIHLAIAVDTPRGLMVPVIRNANLLSLAQISSEAKRLAAACQSGSARPGELSGSTFTVTNLGSFGVTSFTPILNTPEVAILGVCGIEMKPAALPAQEAGNCGCGCNCCCGNGVRFEPCIAFSLTVNHQVVDGAPAAKFLKELTNAVANIDILLVSG